ncbi:PBP1A family penicillin-binding protein [Pseudohoeflea coraliihabitans]|nr:PBP1A family penicillin-binding protein [Pseudohoeflea sp. DP4N28-3]
MSERETSKRSDRDPAGESRHDGDEVSRSGHAFRSLLFALRDDAARLTRQARATAGPAARDAARRLRAMTASAVVSTRRTAAADDRSAAPDTRHRTGSAGLRRLREMPLRRRLVALLAGGALTALLVVALTAVWALHDVPLSKIADETVDPIVVLKSADGEALIQQGPYRGANTPYSAFPDHLVKAVMSIEDRRFMDHWGLDLRGMTRALVRNVTAGQVVEGGSTITQQLLKILYLERDRTIRRKIQEAFLALWIERRMSKEQILERYLNNIYLGAGATGMPAAARIYFSKEVGELTLPESAMLAGLIRAPSQLNPLENPEAARERARTVINAMQAAGHIETDAASDRETAALASLDLNPGREETGDGSWFTDWIRPSAREIAGSFRGDISVSTTLVPELQRMAEAAIETVMNEEGAASGASQAALVALRPDGGVVAMVGGRDYSASSFNRATSAERQPGSTFKLFVYYAALRAGYEPNDRLNDAPIELDGWKPENYGGKFHGRVSLAEAFARSLNAATVQLALDVGIDNVAAAARDLGINADLTETPSLALGASEVTLLDLTGAYASVRAGVAPIEPWGNVSFSVDGSNQSFRVSRPAEPKIRLSEKDHRTLTGLLQLVVDRGTGKAARLDGFAAGKTGTSQNFRDAWFIGFNESMTVGVWVGNDDGTAMDNVAGGGLPAKIWQKFMANASGYQPAGSLISRPQKEGEPLAQARERQAAPACNVRACSRAYRSFRVSDCTFQPYRGRRKLCTK